ncbi:DUF4225 domain-containing protein [Serratia fonticola]|uniref:DUF4225 domain-containing protein n=2 Tax=Serratia fonticola TaxID=47917 RepID=A0AAJ1Y9X7_SERFO|nr:DUF4225 domain-containing protein [Serratia fonticola]MDQ9126283.1 DUF4225 domain-containing protein [Serratia fonticola]
MQEMYDELEDIQRDPYINREDRERGEQKVIGVIISYKQNELMQVMNSVASKYMKWSLAKDKFISEVVSYSNDITSKVNTGEVTQDQAMRSLDQEIANLRKQDETLTRKQYRQAVVVKPIVKKVSKGKNGKDVVDVDLIIAGVGFVSGSLQFVTGVGVASSGASAPFGGLLIAHGINNIVENGYFLLYRESYTGPLKFIYEGVGALVGIDKKDADVIYTVVDLSLSINSLLGVRLEEDAVRLYRYVNTDLLWGLKETGIKLMSKGEFYFEVFGDLNTIVSQYRSY